jgi:hypothetical protein
MKLINLHLACAFINELDGGAVEVRYAKNSENDLFSVGFKRSIIANRQRVHNSLLLVPVLSYLNPLDHTLLLKDQF